MALGIVIYLSFTCTQILFLSFFLGELSPRVLLRADELLDDLVQPAVDVAVLAVEDHLAGLVAPPAPPVDLGYEGLEEYLDARQVRREPRVAVP